MTPNIYLCTCSWPGHVQVVSDAAIVVACRRSIATGVVVGLYLHHDAVAVWCVCVRGYT